MQTEQQYDEWMNQINGFILLKHPECYIEGDDAHNMDEFIKFALEGDSQALLLSADIIFAAD